MPHDPAERPVPPDPEGKAPGDPIHTNAPGLDQLLAIMRRLRDPATGCPWDVEQTYATIAPYTIEEAYEVADAIERGAMDDLRGELGDLLLQVVFHSQMAEEEGHFTFADVVLDDVAVGLPALLRALKLQKRAARVGFDWPSTDQVLAKMAEESAELVEARDTLTQAEVTEEMGDLLFVMANLARHLNVDPEAALRAANAKFTRRFDHIEKALAAKGSSPAESTLEEMDAFWNDAKRVEKSDRKKS